MDHNTLLPCNDNHGGHGREGCKQGLNPFEWGNWCGAELTFMMGGWGRGVKCRAEGVRHGMGHGGERGAPGASKKEKEKKKHCHPDPLWGLKFG